MPDFTLRKTMTFVEDIHHENGPTPAEPRRRAAVVAIVQNPFAGIYADGLNAPLLSIFDHTSSPTADINHRADCKPFLQVCEYLRV